MRNVLMPLLKTVRNMATGILVTVFILGGLVLLARVMKLEDTFIYFPSDKLYSTPEEYGLAFEGVRFGDNGRLHGWFVPGRTDVTILWCHGNAGNLSIPGRIEFMKRLHDRLGVGFFIFDYRGYGQSDGRPSEEGLYQDAQDALAYLRSRDDVNSDRIVYYGKSLGGAVASHLATQDAPYRLILESAFTSTPDMARELYPVLPLQPLLYTRYSNRDHLAQIHVPVLIIHGDSDSQVSLQHAVALHAVANEPKQKYIVPGAGHDDVYLHGGEQYLEVFAEFLDLPLAPA
jgi:hypothetical protein